MPESDRTGLLVVADRVVTSRAAHEPGWVLVRGGSVEALGAGTCLPRVARGVPTRRVTGTVVPGFVDVHCHGGGGASFSDAVDDPDAVALAAAAHLARGTTSLVASLVSAPPGDLLRQVAALAELADSGVVAGVHAEGPWISRRRAGAHDPAALRPPARGEVGAVLAAGRGHLRVVTLAPELDGALDAVRRLDGEGVTVAVGHTDADAAGARAAFDAGARLVTHLFNAMRPLHHRDPGVVGAALVDDRVAVELVLDGHHVARDAAEVARRAAGKRLVLVTDAMAAAAGPRGEHRLGPVTVRVVDGAPRVVLPGAAPGPLAGSALTMDAAFARLVTEHGASLPQAVTATSTRPAAALGLDAGRGGRAPVGDLAPGARADLVVLDGAWSVRAVLRAGEWVA